MSLAKTRRTFKLMNTGAGRYGSGTFRVKGPTPLNLPTYAFELLDKGSDFLENALFFGEVLRI